nr:substrate-binding domain-containing protein [uncultured Desulfobacter sp.]
MFKNVIKKMAIGSAALMLSAGAANADLIEVNLFGASAQYSFWTNAAADFLADQGCASGDIYTLDTEVQSRDTGAAVCAGNTAVAINGGTLSGSGDADGNTIVIRYTSKASYDGIRAVSESNNADWDADDCHTTTGNWGYRLQANLGNATVTGQVLSLPDAAASLSCQDVQIGASDVASETFAQTSSGQLEGPLGGGAFSSQVIYPDDLPSMQEADGFKNIRPVVVPFGFFANNGADDGSYDAVPIDTMTRLQAVSILSGQVTNWSEFDPSVDMRVVLCHRHAGSGTVATLNAAVFRGDASLPTAEVNKTTADLYAGYGIEKAEIYFNEGSSDMMRCVGQTEGAIGYADFDKCLPGTNCVSKGYGQIKRVYFPNCPDCRPNHSPFLTQKELVQNGIDTFWSAQWLYYKTAEPTATKALITDLGAFASLEANLPSSKADYWSSQNAMKYEKADDFALPQKK